MNAVDAHATPDLITLVARQQSLRTIAIRYATLVCVAMLCAQTTSQWLRLLMSS
jgi:diacylglycerol kinase